MRIQVDRAARARWRRAALIFCAAIVSIGGCGGSDPAPVSYNLAGYTAIGDGRTQILVVVPRAYTPEQLRRVFDAVRDEHSEPEQGAFVAIKCETGDDEVGADRLAFGRYAVGARGAALTGLRAGAASFSVLEGRTCAPRSTQEEAVANRPAERADAYALEASGGIRTGCGRAPAPRDATRIPGCIYVAARGGCLYALTRSNAHSRRALRSVIVTPRLAEIYDDGRRSCAP